MRKICILIIIIFLMISIAYSGTIEKVDGYWMYKKSNGEYAKNTWVWLDINGDTMIECYRLDENGHIASNYLGHDGRETNEEGQLIENGFVVKKLLNGKIIKNEGSLSVKKSTVSVINSTKHKLLDERPEEVKGINNGIIITTKIKAETNILATKSNTTNVIYAKVKNDEETKNITNVVAGKHLEKYIKTSNNAKKDVKKAKIFGGDTWEDVIELKGSGASIVVNINKFNYVYFEIAEEKHSIDKENEEFLEVEVYVDGILYDSLDEFVEDKPQIEELDELDGKELEIKLKIDSSHKNRRVYIRNGRLKNKKYD